MLNRDQIAHEYMLQILSRENSQLGFQDAFEVFSKDAFDIADLMIVEAQKRKNVERPTVIGGGWINIKDQLPEDTQEVLAYRPNAHLEPACDRNIKTCKYLATHKTFIGSMHDVTH